MKNRSLVIFIFSGIFLTSGYAHTADSPVVCPAETDLTTQMTDDLAAVMQSYRAHLNEADPIVANSVHGSEASRLQIPQAMSEIQSVVDCAAYVHRNYDGQMVAPSIAARPASEQQAYLELYGKMTLDFLNLLKAYKEMLQLEWQKPVAQQNYQAALNQSMQIHEFANQAHRKF